jgi:hypothetical protein
MELERVFNEEWASEWFELLDEQMGIDLLVKSAANWGALRFYRYLTMKVIDKHPTITWDWRLVCAKSILTIDDVRKYPEKLNDWDVLSANTNFSIEDIMNNLDLPWKFDKIYGNINISAKDVKKYPNFNWNWNKLYIHHNDEGMHFISQNIDKPWDWECISHRIDLKYIVKYPEFPWNWDIASNSEDITTEFIKQNLDKPWDWIRIANRSMACQRANTIKHNIKRTLLLTMHEYHINPDNYTYPLKKIELILADDYLTKKLLNY